MTETRQDTIDFTVMYATHDAFRRDLDRLVAVADAGLAGSPQVGAGWENFKKQLHIHHTVEDADLWPRVRRAVAGREEELALLAEMEAEHALLDPPLQAVDRAITGDRADLPRLARELSAVLVAHMQHEEEAALPLIQSVLTHADWRGFRGAMARAQGIKGVAVYIPWIVDARPLADRKKFLNMMPAPARLLNRLAWEPRYRKRTLWQS